MIKQKDRNSHKSKACFKISKLLKFYDYVLNEGNSVTELFNLVSSDKGLNLRNSNINITEKISQVYLDRRKNMNAQELSVFEHFYNEVIAKHKNAVKYNFNVFCRFIKGYKYQIGEAMSRFDKFYEWEQANGILSLQPSSFPQLENDGFIKFLGNTRDGHSIILFKLKNLKIKSYSPEQINFYIASVLNYSLSMASLSVDAYYMVIDVDDYSKDNFDLNGFKNFIPLFGNYYPDVLFKMVILNLGFIASRLASLIIGFTHEVTRKKIITLGTSKELILETLKKDIDDKYIPQYLGGSLLI